MIVYALINRVNGKIYIGQHKGYDIRKRWNRNLSNRPVNGHLAAAIRKYGPEAFSRKILAVCSCQRELNLVEQFWIAFYGSTDGRYGYNYQSGGIWWDRNEAASSGLTKRVRASKRRKRRRYSIPWNKGLRWSSGKFGRKYGPQANPCQQYPPKSEQHKQRIARALKRYWAWRGGTVQQKSRTQKAFAALSQEAAEAVMNAQRALDQGKSTTYAELQLKAVIERLKKIEFEFKGGCSW